MGRMDIEEMRKLTAGAGGITHDSTSGSIVCLVHRLEASLLATNADRRVELLYGSSHVVNSNDAPGRSKESALPVPIFEKLLRSSASNPSHPVSWKERNDVMLLSLLMRGKCEEENDSCPESEIPLVFFVDCDVLSNFYS